MAIIWNGISSETVGLVVESFPNQPGPARRVQMIKIAGRNGDLLVDMGAYDNYTQLYQVYFNAETKKTPAAARAVRAWLQKNQGYAKLQDTYEPDVYRMACFTGPLEIENLMNRYGRAVLRFNCKPQRFLNSTGGGISVTKTGTVIQNPTDFPALPIIRVNGSGSGEFSVNDTVVRIDSIISNVIFNSEIQDAYRGSPTQNTVDPDGSSQNAAVYAPEFPVLQPGANTISFSGGITSLLIAPRWWTL